MSKKEKKGASGASLVMVEKTGSSRHKPYRPTDLEEDTPVEVHHKRSKPAVHSVAEEQKYVEEIVSSDYEESKERNESRHYDGNARAVSSKRKHKQHHHNSGKQESSSEAIALTTVDAKERKGRVSQPIPSSPIDYPPNSIKVTHSRESITDTLSELRTDTEPTTTGRWPDDEEAGELSLAESNVSRVGRVMRRLLCYTTLYEAPSEEYISGRPERSAI